MAIFCDLSFDVISHDILLYQLQHYGIRGVVNDWHRDYLSSRMQYVSFENKKSSLKSILCGVPQGSILGPLLYLIYVNGIENASYCTVRSFADDTTLLISNPDLKTLYNDSNKEVENMYHWFCSSKLQLNAKKTKYVVIRNIQKQMQF